ncbi:hypothetical protein BGW39_007001, partial [Mortierella sp. 14UC]
MNPKMEEESGLTETEKPPTTYHNLAVKQKAVYQPTFKHRLRSLGYIVMGVNEYYTSKKCPECKQFVGQVDLRRLYCTECEKYMHCDIMAGHNIANTVQGHLLKQERPEYLQSVDSD